MKELERFDTIRAKEIKKLIEAMLLKGQHLFEEMKSSKEKERIFNHDDFLKHIQNVDNTFSTIKKYGTKIRKEQMARGKSPHSSLNHLADFWAESLRYFEVLGVAFVARRTTNNLELERWDMRSAEILKDRWDEFSGCIFCSGTLTPINAFADTIGLEDWKGRHFTLDYDDTRVKTLVLKDVSTKGKRLAKAMSSRYLEALAEFTQLDGNLAVFFASYRVQNALIATGLKRVVESNGKKVFQEVQGMSGDAGRAVLDDFKESAYGDKNGVLLASMQGRFAEGADFPGKELEGIFLVGIPFDQLNLKTELYLDYYKQLYGKEKGVYYAYIVPALRRASQALGRALRSKNDKALFVLGDERYADKRYRRLLPDFVVENMNSIRYTDGKAIRDCWANLGEVGQPTIRDTLQEALEKQITVLIQYHSTTSGLTERKLDPYKLADGYVTGHCYLRKEKRTFKISRISSLELTGDRFVPR